MSFPAWAALAAGIWAVVNGLLHDVFVLRSEHGKKYTRDLLRLLMDGHILLTCGAIQIFSCNGIEQHSHWGYYISAIAALSLVVYCIMIWPFLKSVVTITINLALLGIIIWGYFN